MLPRVQVEHEVGQRPLQPGAGVPVHRKARSRELGGALQVEDAQLLSHFPVRLGNESKMRRLPPAAYFPVGLLIMPCGHGCVRQVGDRVEDGAHGRILRFGLGLQVGNLLPQGAVLLDGRVRVLPFLFQPGDLLGGAVALCLKDFRLVNGLPAAEIEFAKIPQDFGGRHPPLPQFLLDEFQMLPNIIQVKHRKVYRTLKARFQGSNFQS
jgi:hypothetical protein